MLYVPVYVEKTNQFSNTNGSETKDIEGYIN